MELNWDKLIVALDLEDKNQIAQVVDSLYKKGVKFKIGSIAFTKFGPDFVRGFIEKGAHIFLDLKLYDIPNTMKRAAAVITQLGCWCFTVHLQAGQEALIAVRDEVKSVAEDCNKSAPLIFGVTVLTSSSLEMSQREKVILNLAERANTVNIDGVISSPLDVAKIKNKYPNLKVITPGIRNTGDLVDDQKRITTAKIAFENGSDYIVVGRPIIGKKNYLEAAEAILKGQ